MGGCQPPKNMSTVRVLMRIMFAYSARKKSAKVMPEYSTMCPATTSASPSTTSNGARLVSAMPEITYTTNIGNNGIQFHDSTPKPMSAKRPSFWDMTMSLRLRLDEISSTQISAKPIDTSYDTICAAARIEPRKGYFE